MLPVPVGAASVVLVLELELVLCGPPPKPVLKLFSKLAVWWGALISEARDVCADAGGVNVKLSDRDSKRLRAATTSVAVVVYVVVSYMVVYVTVLSTLEVVQ